MHLRCRAACRCSPDSAGPSWPPSDTADIHKENTGQSEEMEVKGGGGESADTQRERDTERHSWPYVEADAGINNDLQETRNAAVAETNTRASI